MTERIKVKGHYRLVERDSKGKFGSVKKWENKGCLKDGKRCYIQHDKETGFEISCRHYTDLTNYGGVCPEVDRSMNQPMEVKKK